VDVSGLKPKQELCWSGPQIQLSSSETCWSVIVPFALQLRVLVMQLHQPPFGVGGSTVAATCQVVSTVGQARFAVLNGVY
jgi:hypothetical protein